MADYCLRLENLIPDVVHRILQEMTALRNDAEDDEHSIKNLSCTSRRMRSHCMPILFRSCYGSADCSTVPPVSIRSFVRNIVYNFVIHDPRTYWIYEGQHCPPPTSHSLEYPEDLPLFGMDLCYFPAVQSVTFDNVPEGVPWSAIMRCLKHPGITSLSFRKRSTWTSASSEIPSDLSLHIPQLTRFAYTPSQWREAEIVEQRASLQDVYATESSYLRALVLPMSAMAESLTLPVETAPLLEMAARDWPRLRTLALTGLYTHPDQCRAIPFLLLRMPNLRSLSIEVAQSPRMLRPHLLKVPSHNVYHLRSLTVSYPNPDDPIFSCLGDGLTALSLRDAPRHCFHERFTPASPCSSSPILSSSECLTILKRISAPSLSVLELVYHADAVEEELLQYLTRTFPLLQELELHRYKAFPDESVPYLHIARTLSSVKYLRALYLNLDIRDGPYKPWYVSSALLQWEKARNARGRELLGILQTGAYFEYVALLLHTMLDCTWTLYRPEWAPRPQIDWRSLSQTDSLAPVIPLGFLG
ncbi:uncharacterized protein TRAVEDRAFT_74794 [Trametes versicolor FP-101664 SS1]|uniref:uncharacterized protein n=1 Tax=Trametes versicolor (strain FP-101664) TaxID=717944 RepID=UPI0004623832|nr:uncharacterized protein TRAVEDRAFT_74794 [Trametes versicolor FP-101664 SS1]EIW53487.1 hypothetical protein TRAVEDRAFT_74794 [Trametes versicolor FP-101664 SS1]